MINPMTLAGIEPATFRFVAHHLKHCATAVPHKNKVVQQNSKGKGTTGCELFYQSIRVIFHMKKLNFTSVCAGNFRPLNQDCDWLMAAQWRFWLSTKQKKPLRLEVFQPDGNVYEYLTLSQGQQDVKGCTVWRVFKTSNTYLSKSWCSVYITPG